MKNILLIGLGRFGRHIAMELSELGHEIMAVDVNAVSYTHLFDEYLLFFLYFSF